MSTQTLDEAARLMAMATFIDRIQILDVGPAVTIGINVTRELTPVGEPVLGSVQTTTLANAAESQTIATYSVKVAKGTTLKAGQAVKVVSCANEPDLNGKVLLIDKMSKNSLAMIRKGVASDFEAVDQQGKEGLA